MAQVNGVERYWNPLLETLPSEKIRELQLKKFRKIVQWAYDHSRFHRRLYQDAALEPSEIRTWDDVRRVPKVEKAMMREIQRKDPFPYGDMLCVPLDRVTEFHQTSGTTGQPVYQPDTWQDWEWWSECWSYIMYAQGFRDTDRAFIPFGLYVEGGVLCSRIVGDSQLMVHFLQGGEKRLTLRLRSHRLPLSVDCRPSALETLLGTLGLAGEVQAPNDKQAWAVSTVG